MLEQRAKELQHEIEKLRNELESEKVETTNFHYALLVSFFIKSESLNGHILLYFIQQ